MTQTIITQTIITQTIISLVKKEQHHSFHKRVGKLKHDDSVSISVHLLESLFVSLENCSVKANIKSPKKNVWLLLLLLFSHTCLPVPASAAGAGVPSHPDREPGGGRARLHVRDEERGRSDDAGTKTREPGAVG